MKNIRFYSLLVLIMLMACGARMKAQIQDDDVGGEPVGECLITKVIINENDCFRCFGGNQILQRLSEVSKVELVFNGLDDNFIYDLNRDTTYTLPMKCELSMEGKSMTNLMVKSNGHVVDWSFDGNDLSVIYFDEVNKECKFIFLKKGAKDFVNVPLSFGGRLKCPYLFMVSPRVFYYLNLENEVCAKVINAELLQMQ